MPAGLGAMPVPSWDVPWEPVLEWRMPERLSAMPVFGPACGEPADSFEPVALGALLAEPIPVDPVAADEEFLALMAEREKRIERMWSLRGRLLTWGVALVAMAVGATVATKRGWHEKLWPVSRLESVDKNAEADVMDLLPWAKSLLGGGGRAERSVGP
jgi:hypothetical protein